MEAAHFGSRENSRHVTLTIQAHGEIVILSYIRLLYSNQRHFIHTFMSVTTVGLPIDAYDRAPAPRARVGICTYRRRTPIYKHFTLLTMSSPRGCCFRVLLVKVGASYHTFISWYPSQQVHNNRTFCELASARRLKSMPNIYKVDILSNSSSLPFLADVHTASPRNVVKANKRILYNIH